MIHSVHGLSTFAFWYFCDHCQHFHLGHDTSSAWLVSTFYLYQQIACIAMQSIRIGHTPRIFDLLRDRCAKDWMHTAHFISFEHIASRMIAVSSLPLQHRMCCLLLHFTKRFASTVQNTFFPFPFLCSGLPLQHRTCRLRMYFMLQLASTAWIYRLLLHCVKQLAPTASNAFLSPSFYAAARLYSIENVNSSPSQAFGLQCCIALIASQSFSSSFNTHAVTSLCTAVLQCPDCLTLQSFLALVDTYDTLVSGIPNFLVCALAMYEIGYKPLGIRLDSGDLAYLSLEARKMFRMVEEQFNMKGVCRARVCVRARAHVWEWFVSGRLLCFLLETRTGLG